MSTDNSHGSDPERSRRQRQRVLSDRVKRIYDEVVREPIPTDFLSLLEEADDASALRGENGSKRGGNNQ
jgi:hypothetical protein